MQLKITSVVAFMTDVMVSNYQHSCSKILSKSLVKYDGGKPRSVKQFCCFAGLVVITSMAGYAMAPGAFHLSTFLLCTLGTGLQSASANAINQVRLR